MSNFLQCCKLGEWEQAHFMLSGGLRCDELVPELASIGCSRGVKLLIEFGQTACAWRVLSLDVSNDIKELIIPTLAPEDLRSALLLACEHGHLDDIRFLGRHHPPDISMFERATKYKQKEACLLLIEYGASASWGLETAVSTNSEEMVEFLLHLGACPVMYKTQPRSPRIREMLKNEIVCVYFKHFRHEATYKSAPPIRMGSSLSPSRRENAASSPHEWQTAVRRTTSSQRGISSETTRNGLR